MRQILLQRQDKFESTLTPRSYIKCWTHNLHNLLLSFSPPLKKCSKNSKIGGRLAHLESKMDDKATAHNSLADSLQQIEEKLTKHEMKLTDLEDRSRRNNPRLHGIPESIAMGDMVMYATTMFRALCPDIPSEMFLLERMHRVAK
ncbi:Hypothetical predicted protein, partial [Pelobates cultripes]